MSYSEHGELMAKFLRAIKMLVEEKEKPVDPAEELTQWYAAEEQKILLKRASSNLPEQP